MRDIVISVNLPLLNNGDLTANGNCSIAINGELICAVAEERISRVKYDGHVDQTLRYFVQKYKILPEEVSKVIVSSFWQPLEVSKEKKAFMKAYISNIFGYAVDIEYINSHHEAHAYLWAVESWYDKALVVVLDHTWSILHDVDSDIAKSSVEQTSYYLLNNNEVKLVERDHDIEGDVWFGRLFSMITRYVWFGSYHEAGKTMWLAPFGHKDVFGGSKLYSIDEQGKMKNTITYRKYSNDSLKDLEVWFKERGYILPWKRLKDQKIRQVDMDLAYRLHEEIRSILVQRLETMMKKYFVNKLIIVWWVALNSVVNYKITKDLWLKDVYIPASPWDVWISLWALYLYLSKKMGKLYQTDRNYYLGPIYTSEEVEMACKNFEKKIVVKQINDPESMCANLLYKWEIVWWFQGRSEFWPRALWNRSIFASPTNSWTKERLNNFIKDRERFRPYAPVILKERVLDFFEDDLSYDNMMMIWMVKRNKIKEIPSAIHVDNSARLQTVSKLSNASFHKIIEEFDLLSWVPVVLNTSFNLAWMPIVESPVDAIDCFLQSNLDCLVLDKYLIRRK